LEEKGWACGKLITLNHKISNSKVED